MEFFTLKDKGPLINLNGRKPKFVKNAFKGFSSELQTALNTLEEEMYLRNFNVPGFELEFCFNIDRCEIDIFKLTNWDLGFRMTSDWEINIKGKEVSIHSDGSGSLDLYVLDNWERDKKEFMDGVKFHRKMDGKSRLCIHYNLWNATFTATDDIGRGYAPEGDEPKSFSKRTVEKELLEQVNIVLAEIRKTPVAEVIEDVFSEPEPVYLSNDLFKGTVFYAFCNDYNQSEARTNGLSPGKRLLNLGVKLPEHPLAKTMHEGFVYLEVCKEDDVPPTKPTDTRKHNYSERVGPFTIVPKHVNDFYVIDASVFETKKAEWFAANPTQEYLSDALMADFERDEAVTIVPINDYQGGYKKPVVIVNRRIWPEEVAVLVHQS